MGPGAIEGFGSYFNFVGSDLTATLAHIESKIAGLGADECVTHSLADWKATPTALTQALAIKKLAGQVNVVVHALGILNCLPEILEEGERVQYVSLGAGNTGRKFDLETDRRVAEFKFIDWKGGPESIRQNNLFKDFFELASHPTHKRKILYVIGDTYAQKFFKSKRSLESVLSKNIELHDRFRSMYGPDFRVVADYYSKHASAVEIVDVAEILTAIQLR